MAGFMDFEQEYGIGGGQSGILGGAIDATTGGGGGFAGNNPPPDTDWFSSGNFLGKGGTGSMMLGGLKTLGSLWNSYQMNKQAKKEFKFQKMAFKTNLANQTQVYNTALEGRIRARYFTEGRSTEEADAKFEENRL